MRSRNLVTALVIPIAKRFPLAQIREAQQFAEQGAGGKVIVRVSERLRDP